ncbi:putative glycoprotease GCP [Mesotoga prima MesG1.Ag.4.2]|uniref:tRNA N6-adenosine threonylcarbamoyltransferase n=1 Tax=Mesotoga prima MesG1.Ag.4.2 TaxID=660470 RepID=I2F3K5_9BACT|nr:tRNA (adenosine(37)-N6)-threonylcarbamoyltransferase complex transferase subunit TsaD [Mesotoga prima]AFK06508.1 putative glycoprotease GCP [Mesotoga prima MesG1.Ag.4.2]
MKVLALESSCDETAVAIIEDGRLLSSQISSQIDIHKRFGGVVPEIAARKHLEIIDRMVSRSLEEADLDIKEIDVFASTMGPGLVGSLLIGLSFAKGMAIAMNKPFVGVNHLFGHVYANFLRYPLLKPPFMVLLVSGGHTEILVLKDWDRIELVGKTRDDAAGEAFDKIARLLGLGYPGGPAIQEAAEKGQAKYHFPRPLREKGNFDFSFSGLKTSVLYFMKKNPLASVSDVAASAQEAIVDSLVTKAFDAAESLHLDEIAFAGGVASNSLLREWARVQSEVSGIKAYFPPVDLCTDNAAMIALVAHEKAKRGLFSPLSTNAVPYLTLDFF